MALPSVRRRRTWATAVVVGAAVACVVTATATAAPVRLGQIGSTGSDAGEVEGVLGLDVDAGGNLVLAEFLNNRISIFTAEGEFVRAFGFDVVAGGGTGLEVCTTATGCQSGDSGGGAGQLDLPTEIAIDSAGRIHVTDTFNHRISTFSGEGGFIRAFGFDVIPGGGAGFEVCTTTTGCQGATSGGAAGQLSQPSAIVADDAGRLHVADRQNHRISTFTDDGAFVRAFGWDVVPGNLEPELEACVAVCTPADPGGGAGQLNEPGGVDVDDAGNLHIGDNDNNRVSTFTPAGGFIRAFGFNVDPGGGSTLESCTTATTCQVGAAGPEAGQLANPFGVAVDNAGNLHVADNANQRMSSFAAEGGFLHAFGFDVIPGDPTGYEVCTATSGCKIGVAGGAPGQIDEPIGTAADCEGGILVAEGFNDRVERFGEAGTPACAFRLGKAMKNKRKGTAKLEVEVPGSGELRLRGRKLKKTEKDAEDAGELRLRVKPRGKAKQKLAEIGKLKVKAKVTFAPVGADPRTENKKIKLKKKL
jgi:DNA-binding beta-propeller fold protein YncE